MFWATSAANLGCTTQKNQSCPLLTYMGVGATLPYRPRGFLQILEPFCIPEARWPSPWARLRSILASGDSTQPSELIIAELA